MPAYPFVCAAGHETELLTSMSAVRPKSLTCVCGLVSRRRFVVPQIVLGQRDEFNLGLGRNTSKSGLRELQKRRQDDVDRGLIATVPEPFEGGVPDPPSDWS